jgi:ParB/RepB/Spo0J family partition protein
MNTPYTAPMSAPDFAQVPLTAIVSSPHNPRKSFNQDKLSELASTIKASGVHTPILLRYLPPARLQETFADRKKNAKLPEYEIVAGERRYRASLMAGMTTIPALIRGMTDEQALEVMFVENLQRDDLSELEEAEGYQQQRRSGRQDRPQPPLCVRQAAFAQAAAACPHRPA